MSTLPTTGPACVDPAGDAAIDLIPGDDREFIPWPEDHR